MTTSLFWRGSLTLPSKRPSKIGLDKLRNPLLILEEREGGLFLHPAAALLIRDLPKARITVWIARAEGAMKAFQATGKSGKK